MISRHVLPNVTPVILANTEGGHGAWYEIAAPVPVPDAFDNFCPNYSSTLAPIEDGRVTLEVASKWENDRCRSFYARGPLHGTDDASGLTDGTGYVGRALNSGFCVDVVDGLPRCMDLITADEVIRRIETYFRGGALRYPTAEPADVELATP